MVRCLNLEGVNTAFPLSLFLLSDVLVFFSLAVKGQLRLNVQLNCSSLLALCKVQILS